MDGAFITWIDHRNSIGTPANRDVYVQYIKSATATFPPLPTSWVANGISVSANPQHDQINPELDLDNIITLDLLGQMTQGVVITYQDDRYLGATSGVRQPYKRGWKPIVYIWRSRWRCRRRCNHG
jgi:hypothetical protein